MKESIRIKNLGPIKDVYIDDIKRMTVFVGCSGSGKSTIMKVLALFQYIYKRMSIRSYLYYSNITKSPFKCNFKSYIKQNGLEDFIRPESVVVYQCGNCVIKYENGTLKGTTKKIDKEELSLEKMSYISDKRSVIANLSDGKLSMRDKGAFYLDQTYSDYKRAVDEISSFDMEYLGIRWFQKKTNSGRREFIQPVDGRDNFTIGFKNASSGTQTIVPLNLIVEYFSQKYDLVKSMNEMIFSYVVDSDMIKTFRAIGNIGDIKNKRIRLFIEEPELSLYPSHQINLLNFLIDRSFVSNRNGCSMSLMIATHSPYIINYLNLLMKAYDKDLKIENASIAYEDLGVYLVEDGEIQDLKIKNAHLVNTDVLSEDIEKIYEEYQKLG